MTPPGNHDVDVVFGFWNPIWSHSLASLCPKPHPKPMLLSHKLSVRFAKKTWVIALVDVWLAGITGNA
jgi:hypothetical protein